MNVTEFAEQVVFGKTLADKLVDPGRITNFCCHGDGNGFYQGAEGDFAKTVRRLSLDSPGRPLELRMQHGASVSPPKVANLDDEQSRGQLLHFLANHELLATELMALVLLKFPEAPAAFRQGVLVTLREEQQHTQMYLDRMAECGVEFGSYPVSGHFWRVVEPMRSPMDFVSRLSLTFEQANLDYSRYFAKVFRQVGDLATAAVLEQIYEDEIGHVRHGLQWFRQWKDPGQSDWDAYQSSLSFPMSPERARGPQGAFNREGRMAAGLSNDFIDAVELFRQSRGRTPTVRWFDAAAEASLTGELSPRSQQLMGQLGIDLELLMVTLAKRDDIVLVRRMPSQSFRRQLLDAGFELPEFISLDDRSALADRKLRELSPWAWTPSNYDLARPLLKATREPPPRWNEARRDLFCKSWAANRLREWIEHDDESLPFVSSQCAGILVHSIDQLSAAMEHFADRGYKRILVKHNLATSGRGQRQLRCETSVSGSAIGDADLAWLRAMLRDGNGVVVEPELNRLLDLSFLWHLSEGDSDLGGREPKFLGWTRPIISPGRRYSGTKLGRPISDMDGRLTRFLMADGCQVLHRTSAWLAERLTTELRQRQFAGPFGIDAFVCEDDRGELKMKPMVELNPRLTMGHVALQLEKRLSPGVAAEFRVLSRSEWQQHHSMILGHPLMRSTDGRWKSGVVCLNEVRDQTKLIPLVLVGHACELMSQ